MGETPGSKRSSSTLVPILIIVVAVCVVGVVIIGAVAFAAFAFLGVSAPSSAPARPTLPPRPAVTVAAVPVNPASPAGSLIDQVAAGEASVDSVSVAQPGETIGPLLSVQVGNTGGEIIDTRLACGTIFQPGDNSEQRLMVIQETMVTVPPGQTADLEAYVACIDSDLDSPSGQGNYSVAAVADGRLLTLADCLCGQDIQTQAEADPMWALAVQFAVWSVSDDIDLSALLEGTETSEGALGEVFGGPMGTVLRPFLKDIVAQSETLLSECGVGQ